MFHHLQRYRHKDLKIEISLRWAQASLGLEEKTSLATSRLWNILTHLIAKSDWQALRVPLILCPLFDSVHETIVAVHAKGGACSSRFGC